MSNKSPMIQSAVSENGADGPQKEVVLLRKSKDSSLAFTNGTIQPEVSLRVLEKDRASSPPPVTEERIGSQSTLTPQRNAKTHSLNAGRQSEGEAEKREYTGKNRLSKAFFLGGRILGDGPYLILMMVGNIKEDNNLILLSFIPMLIGTVTFAILIYKMWAAIQDGHARTSPGKAVGFLFIPFFNIYWKFQAIWGFAKDYNALVERHSLNVPKLPEDLFLSYLILGWTLWIPIIGLILAIIYYIKLLNMVAKICDAVNALPPEIRAGKVML